MESASGNESDLKDKAAFAAFLLKYPDDPAKAAFMAFPDNNNRALWAARFWPNDQDVLLEKQRLVEDQGQDAFLADEVEVCNMILARMRSQRTDNEEFVKLTNLYAEIRAMKKDKNKSGITIVNQPNVMVVRDFGTNEEWEAKAASQQAKLVEQFGK